MLRENLQHMGDMNSKPKKGPDFGLNILQNSNVLYFLYYFYVIH